MRRLLLSNKLLPTSWCLLCCRQPQGIQLLHVCCHGYYCGEASTCILSGCCGWHFSPTCSRSPDPRCIPPAENPPLPAAGGRRDCLLCAFLLPVVVCVFCVVFYFSPLPLSLDDHRLLSQIQIPRQLLALSRTRLRWVFFSTSRPKKISNPVPPGRRMCD